jgi:hypothetical protein
MDYWQRVEDTMEFKQTVPEIEEAGLPAQTTNNLTVK